jgi:hypothetical protein
MEPEGSLPCSQEPSTGPPEPDRCLQVNNFKNGSGHRELMTTNVPNVITEERVVA